MTEALVSLLWRYSWDGPGRIRALFLVLGPWHHPAKRPGLEALVTQAGLWSWWQRFKGHDEPFENKKHESCGWWLPISTIWSPSDFRILRLWASLVDDFLLRSRPRKGSRLKRNSQLLWNGRTRKLFSVWLFTTQCSGSWTPPALPRTTLKCLNLPVTPVNPVK